jgi:hypothetical protein
MRYARASLQKLNKDRFSKESFWQKYGATIMNIIFIVVIAVLLMLIASKLVELTGRLDAVLQSSSAVMDKADKVLGSVDKVCSNSGIVKV